MRRRRRTVAPIRRKCAAYNGPLSTYDGSLYGDDEIAPRTTVHRLRTVVRCMRTMDRCLDAMKMRRVRRIIVRLQPNAVRVRRVVVWRRREPFRVRRGVVSAAAQA